MSRLNAEAIVEYVSRLNYGDEISLERISQLIGEEIGTCGFGYSFAIAREILIENGILLKSDYNGSVKILNPNEISEEVYSTYVRSGMNKFKKGLRILENIDTKYLSKEEKKEKEIIEEMVENLISSGHKEIDTKLMLLNQKKYRTLGE